MKYPYTHILIRYGELALKGKNQGKFIQSLENNIRQKLGSSKNHLDLRSERGYVVIDARNDSEEDLRAKAEKLCQVSGVVLVSPAIFSKENSIDTLYPLVKQVMGSYPGEKKSFCVRAKRADKAYPLTSGDIEKKVGKYIQDATECKVVNLKHPDIILHIDIVPKGVFLYMEKKKGIWGLPVGIEGRVLSLLSGGIDSPVASFFMARRGCEVDFIHFTANKIQSDEAVNYKVAKIAQILSQYSIHSKLYLMPYIHFHLAIVGKKVDYELILFRRFMARVAEALAKKIGVQALVTGDNLGQVASQTLSNIVSTSQAVRIPIFRPLIGFDKNEIIDMAKKIGTYDLSIEPYKDCCSLISKNPKTVSDAARLELIEKNSIPDYAGIMEATIKDAEILEIKNGSIMG